MRAAHLLRDPPPWILEDFLARRMLGSAYFNVVDVSVERWPSELFAAFRAHFAVRARLAEDVAVDGLGANRRDYVILGAGADTFAWRHPLTAAFTIWEVDHPASQAWKRDALERANLAVSPNIRLVPADLATIPLEHVALPNCATWNWLGVTQYLEKSATEATLQAIVAKGSGTTLVVEFLLAEASCDALGAAFRARSIEAGRTSMGTDGQLLRTTRNRRAAPRNRLQPRGAARLRRTHDTIPTAGQRPAGSECGDVRDRNDMKRTLRLEVTLSVETARCGASGSRLM